MHVEQLDLIFPFFVFGYGLIVTLVLNWPRLLEKAEGRIPDDMLQQIQGHRMLALVCLAVGSLWSLQTLWL